MENKRLILAIAFAVVIFVLWNLVFAPQQPTAPQNQETQTAQTVDNSVARTTPDAAEIPAPQQIGSRKIIVDHPLYIAEFDERGAMITSFKLKKYHETSEDSSPLRELLPPEFNLSQVGLHPVGAPVNSWNNITYSSNVDEDNISVTNEAFTLIFSMEDQKGIKVDKCFTFNPENYVITFDTFITNLAEAPWNNALAFELEGINQNALKNQQLVATTAAMFKGKLTNIKTRPKDFKQGTFTTEGHLDWIASQSRYFIIAMMPNVPTQTVVTVVPDAEKTHVTSMYTEKFELQPGDTKKITNLLYFGPKEIDTLKTVGHNLNKVVNFGFFDILAKPFLWFMKQIYNVIPNYGVAIIILTLVIKIILFPLGTKSYKSMSNMKKLQPLIKEIQEKYKNDKMRISQETMALYKTYKVNPAKGCLPMVVQIPVFFALYRMLYGAIELHHTPFIGWITDLSAPDRLFNLGVSIPFMEPPIGIPVLTLLMGASMFLQQKMSPPMGDPNQRRIMMLMPIMFTVIFINFSSGLVLYWFTNNIFSILQQYYVQKKYK